MTLLAPTPVTSASHARMAEALFARRGPRRDHSGARPALLRTPAVADAAHKRESVREVVVNGRVVRVVERRGISRRP